MTHEFRKAAYEAVERAEAEGVSAAEFVEVIAPPGRYAYRLSELKRQLYVDRQARKRQRVRTA